MKSRLSKFAFKINTVTIRNLMLLAVILVILTSLAEEANASSRYYCSSSTITLEVKSPIALPAPLVSPPESGDGSDTAISDDNNPDHRDNGDGIDTAVSDDEESDETEKADQQSGQSDGSTGDGREADETLAPRHNALIISRFTKDHSLHTEIKVDNITSSDQVFIDVFSGDQEAGNEADSVFISFENENGTVKTVRIGLDEQIDNITVLDGVSETQQTQQTASSPDEFHHIDSSLGFEQILSPVIVVIPDTNERIYFSNAKALLDHVFQERYRIESVRAIRDEMEIRLVKK